MRVTLKLRYVCAPFDISKATDEGLVTNELLGIYEQRKRPALIIVEQCYLAKRLEAAGVDLLDISSGLRGSGSFTGEAFFRPMLAAVKRHVNIPVIGSGHLENIDLAADMVAKNEVDFIALGRAILQQPNYVEGLLAQIRSRQ